MAAIATNNQGDLALINFLFALLILLSQHVIIIGPGAIGRADEGVLETVVENRNQINGGWGVPGIVQKQPPRGHQLLAVANCDYLGANAYVIAGRTAYRATVIDCAWPEDARLMKVNGYIADCSR